jgi:hypothetical protein
MPKRSGKRKSSGKKSKTRCGRCGRMGHNKNNKKYHSLSNKESPSKYENCVMDVKGKQSKWCADKGYPAYEKDPSGKRCYSPFAVCARLR